MRTLILNKFLHRNGGSETYSANCKDISFDTIDEYYEKIMKVYQ